MNRFFILTGPTKERCVALGYQHKGNHEAVKHWLNGIGFAVKTEDALCFKVVKTTQHEHWVETDAGHLMYHVKDELENKGWSVQESLVSPEVWANLVGSEKIDPFCPAGFPQPVK